MAMSSQATRRHHTAGGASTGPGLLSLSGHLVRAATAWLGDPLSICFNSLMSQLNHPMLNSRMLGRWALSQKLPELEYQNPPVRLSSLQQLKLLLHRKPFEYFADGSTSQHKPLCDDMCHVLPPSPPFSTPPPPAQALGMWSQRALTSN